MAAWSLVPIALQVGDDRGFTIRSHGQVHLGRLQHVDAVAGHDLGAQRAQLGQRGGGRDLGLEVGQPAAGVGQLARQADWWAEVSALAAAIWLLSWSIWVKRWAMALLQRWATELTVAGRHGDAGGRHGGAGGPGRAPATPGTARIRAPANRPAARRRGVAQAGVRPAEPGPAGEHGMRRGRSFRGVSFLGVDGAVGRLEVAVGGVEAAVDGGELLGDAVERLVLAARRRRPSWTVKPTSAPMSPAPPWCRRDRGGAGGLAMAEPAAADEQHAATAGATAAMQGGARRRVRRLDRDGIRRRRRGRGRGVHGTNFRERA